MRADQPILRFTLMGLISGSSFVFFSCRNVQDEPLMQDQNARATKVEYNVKKSYLLSDEGLIQALSSIIKTSSIARKAALIQNLSKTRVAEYSGTAVRSIAIPLPGGLYYLTYAKSDKVMRRE